MRILNREMKPLSTAERDILIRVRRKKIMFLVKAYLALTGILALIYITTFIKPSNVLADAIQRYKNATYILTYGSLLIFTCMFIFYYFRVVHPFTLDIKRGMKTVSWFVPVSYKTPFFAGYYIKTGSKKKPMLPIPEYMYKIIEPGAIAYIFSAPSSRFLFLLNINGLETEYNEENGGFE